MWDPVGSIGRRVLAQTSLGEVPACRAGTHEGTLNVVKRVVTAVVVGVVALALPSCAASNDVDDVAAISAANNAAASQAAADAAAAAKHPMPGWLAAGLKAATDRIAASKAGQLATTETGDANALPDKKSFSDILTASGFGQKAADCVYDKLASSPDRSKLSPAITTVASALKTQIPTASSPGGVTGSSTALLSGLSASGLTSIAGLDSDVLNKFVTAITPCLDVETLLSLYGTLGGAGGGGGAAGALGGIGSATGAAGILALLVGAGSGAGGTGATGGAGSAQAAAAGAQSLPPGAQGLVASLAALVSTPEGQAAVASKLNELDPSKANVTNLSSDNLPLVVAAFLTGLTPAQHAELENVSGVNFASLGLLADPAKMTDEQKGAALLVSIPFIAAGLSATAGAAPAGADPAKIYVPPGADLSGINPLNFYPKDNFIGALANNGLSAAFGGCLYEKWRAVDPLLIGAGFSGGTSLGVAQLVLGLLSCTAG